MAPFSLLMAGEETSISGACACAGTIIPSRRTARDGAEGVAGAASDCLSPAGGCFFSSCCFCCSALAPYTSLTMRSTAAAGKYTLTVTQAASADSHNGHNTRFILRMFALLFQNPGLPVGLPGLRRVA